MAKNENKESVFATLNAINVNGHTEKKPTGNNKELTYLSWPWAFAEVKKRYPDASYTIYRDEQNRPYVEDKDFGLMCMTTVTIEGQTHEMWLPVMDGSNKAMKRQPWSYKIYDYKTRQFVEKWVAAATMFDINKTIMRCLVKNLAMFGLGLYIYAGEDLPEEPSAEAQAPTPAPEQKKQAEAAAEQQTLFNDNGLEEAFFLIKANIESAPSVDYLMDIYKQNPELHDYKPFRNAMSKRKKEIGV